MTRGTGAAEGWLAKRRIRQALRLIPEYRYGLLVDLGCGSGEWVRTAPFYETSGLDRPEWSAGDRIRVPSLTALCVTMLAVWEHLTEAAKDSVIDEVARVLEPGGTFILTTPAPWTDLLLRVLARFNVVSPEEIDEHIGMEGRRAIAKRLKAKGFEVTHGRFLFGMNQWVKAKKP